MRFVPFTLDFSRLPFPILRLLYRRHFPHRLGTRRGTLQGQLPEHRVGKKISSLHTRLRLGLVLPVLHRMSLRSLAEAAGQLGKTVKWPCHRDLCGLHFGLEL